jgi:hypothetical protein
MLSEAHWREKSRPEIKFMLSEAHWREKSRPEMKKSRPEIKLPPQTSQNRNELLVQKSPPDLTSFSTSFSEDQGPITFLVYIAIRFVFSLSSFCTITVCSLIRYQYSWQ